MENETSVKISGLVKTFNQKEVIKNCNMTVSKGSVYGLLGVNGAGKTTIFKMLMGLLQPTAGHIEIFGKDIQVDKNSILRNVGSMIETPIFYEHLSAIENLEIHLSYMGIQNTDIQKTLGIVGLHDIGNQPVSEFSLGMRQRLGIARAIIHQPKLLILDEPINGLDPVGIREMRKLFQDLVKIHDMTVLVSSHILSEIEHIADVIGIIADGSIVEEIELSTIEKDFAEGLEEYFFNIVNGGMKQNA
ncbi:ABC transporter ATP-binding protein [Neobacillus massiliamazoniensis]|uniref:Bacitracin ABC transporter ATP-binding protein n=1 Tax=Neobacillus massiliamazoniensis TaxID=1499688 RepID=A0A0U1P166_9BACI|nr:ATP-binding cassette domain-containing protein [Neobacillus massiliamazoniensis]CRK83858.1 bacitracin ABC transporter ATP-binding protein [Neobacillus massiliamazoniensis]